MIALVSILIPAYNAEKTLAETIESALAQTWKCTEIIVLDDGSRDRTAEIAQRFEPRVKVVSTPNQGAAGARNELFRLSKGDYIQWLDADDLLAPNKIECQLDALGENGSKRILLSSPWGQFYHRISRARFIPDALWQDLTPVEWMFLKLSQNLLMSNANWLTSRELSEAAGSFDSKLFFDDDGEYFSRVLLLSEGTRFVTGTAAYYRFGGSGSVSHIGNSNIKRDSLFRSMKLHMQYLRSLEESSRVRQACLTYMQNWFGVFYPEKSDAVRELKQMAEELGGHLEEPVLRWKYAWMTPLFGSGGAKWAQNTLPAVKANFVDGADRALFWLEKKRSVSAKSNSGFSGWRPIAAGHDAAPMNVKNGQGIQPSTVMTFAVQSRVKPFVSILVPAYNAEATIAQTLQSAVNQTCQCKEIIVVDDGSKDRTAEIAEEFSPSVRVVRTLNQGAAAARNHAYALSQGDYIQWLDADDLLAPDKIERQLALAATSNSRKPLLAGPWSSFFFRTKHVRFVPDPLWQDLTAVEWLLRKMGQNLWAQTATWLTSRELAEAAGPWDTRLLSDDDGEYFCRVLLAAGRTQFVPDAKVYYRTSVASRLSYVGSSDKKKDALFISLKLHVEYIRSLEESERVRKACLAYLKNWYLVFYPERTDLVEELQELASSIGGHLGEPSLRWKYAWMRPVFGWKAAKLAQLSLPELRLSCARNCDKALYRLSGTRESPKARQAYLAGIHHDV